MDRRILTPEDMEKLEAIVVANPVLNNAFRLMRDGDLLFAHERYSSAVGLTVLCLEEIGKHLLMRWAAANPAFHHDRRALHKMKQGAVAALFMADTVRREYLRQGVNFSDLGTPEKMAVLAKALRTGIDKENAFAASVKAGMLQVIKHSGLYYDEVLVTKGIEPSKITVANADEMMRTCSRAFVVLTDDKAVAIAGDIFSLIHKKRSHKAGASA